MVESTWQEKMARAESLHNTHLRMQRRWSQQTPANLWRLRITRIRVHRRCLVGHVGVLEGPPLSYLQILVSGKMSVMAIFRQLRGAREPITFKLLSNQV